MLITWKCVCGKWIQSSVNTGRHCPPFSVGNVIEGFPFIHRSVAGDFPGDLVKAWCPTSSSGVGELCALKSYWGSTSAHVQPLDICVI